MNGSPLSHRTRDQWWPLSNPIWGNDSHFSSLHSSPVAVQSINNVFAIVIKTIRQGGRDWMIERKPTEFVVAVVVVATLLLDLQWLYQRYGLFTSGNYWSAWRTLGCQSNVSHPFSYPNKKGRGEKEEEEEYSSSRLVVDLFSDRGNRIRASADTMRQTIRELFSTLLGDLFLSFDCVCVCLCCVYTHPHDTRHPTATQ